MAATGLVTIGVLARRLGVHRTFLRAAADSGELPSFRVGAMLRFDPAEIRAFVRGERHDAAVRLRPRKAR